MEPLPSPNQPGSPSLIVTAFWALFLYMGPSALVGLGFGIYAGVVGIQDVDVWFARLETIIAMTFVIYLLVIPLVWRLAKESAASSKATAKQTRQFLNLTLPVYKTLVQVVLATLLFWLALNLVSYLFDIPDEPFMALLKNSSIPVWFLFVNACVLAPVVEELVFRGFLFKRIALTSLAQTGAIVVTSILFAVIHVQYSMAGILFVFILGLYFTWVRVKYQSTSLAIVAHMVCNLMTMIALYFAL